MLAVSKYTQQYVDDCRTSVEAQISAYRDLMTAAGAVKPNSTNDLAAAIEAFDHKFFNNMVLVLDHYFCHRVRNAEGKDGNPLNEVRVLCDSIMGNQGIMVTDKTIRLKAATSLLKYEVGDEIKLSEADYRLLSKAFLAELESRYV